MPVSTPKCSRHPLQKLKTKLQKNLPRHGNQNEKRGKRQEKAANLQRGYSTDQLPNHNSKTMSNKKLSKSNFHRHPLFSRSHLSSFWRIWRVQRVLYSSQRQRKEFHREKSARAQTLGSNNGILDTGEWTCNQWMWLIQLRILTKGFQTNYRCPAAALKPGESWSESPLGALFLLITAAYSSCGTETVMEPIPVVRNGPERGHQASAGGGHPREKLQNCGSKRAPGPAKIKTKSPDSTHQSWKS